MLACKGIFTKPSISQLSKAQSGSAAKSCEARLSAFIIQHFSQQINSFAIKSEIISLFIADVYKFRVKLQELEKYLWRDIEVSSLSTVAKLGYTILAVNYGNNNTLSKIK